jgi:hypothetical protein
MVPDAVVAELEVEVELDRVIMVSALNVCWNGSGFGGPRRCGLNK